MLRDLKEFKFKPVKRFKELLGHTRTQVLWGFVTGIIWATIVCSLWK
jgi:acid phosphatase family membrane protein YuiD